jgi:cytochrome c-type biogenesis protein CcmH/NrfF
MIKGDVLSPLLFNFTSEHAISDVQGNKDRLEFNVALHCLVCADDNLLGVNVIIGNKITDALLHAIKEVGLSVHGDITQYLLMPRHQTAGQVTA